MTKPPPRPASTIPSSWCFSQDDSWVRVPITMSTVSARERFASTNACDGPSAIEFEPQVVLSFDLAIDPPGVASSQFVPHHFQTIGCLFPEGRARFVERSIDVSGRPSNGFALTESTLKPDRSSSLSTAAIRRTDAIAGGDYEASSAIRPSTAEPRLQCGRTRIRPPRDVIKLEDRLRMLLEPPLESLLASGSLRFAFPPFPYQLDGIAFLYPRHQAILADDMGLGKTMQAITAIRLLIHQRQVRNVLLVCPKSLVTNWRREFSLWAPEILIQVIDGHPGRRHWLWREAACLVTIVNYETVVRDRLDLCDDANYFDLVVLDESQRIKNADSATSQVVRSIARGRSWALTGTPIENSIDDLVGIFEFVAPGSITSQMKPRAISRAVHDYVLRRTKERVLTELPPKLFRDADVELTAEQAASYQLAEDEGIIRLRDLEDDLTIQHVFELVLRLKQICNFDPTTGSSSKLERLEADLDECGAAGGKAIVFSQWVETLEEIRSRLAQFHPVEYHGRVPVRRRDDVIQKFRDDPDCHVILMSYGAGSVGLNLQFASYVFLFDRWWNPAVEDQAINRAHRIGATQAVTVTRFLTVSTIEQRINQVLERKRELFDSVFGDADSTPRGGLSREEIFSLFDLNATHHC